MAIKHCRGGLYLLPEGDDIQPHYAYTLVHSLLKKMQLFEK